jgi:inner membrane transporter RhtA
LRLPADRLLSIGRDHPARGRLTAVGLVIASSFSAQLGAAFAVGLIRASTPSMAAMVRNLVGAVVLVALVGVRGGSLRGINWRPAVLLGVILGVMNTAFYAGIERLPLGDAVAVEFMGPVAVAAITSSRRRELVWVALAALGVLAISHPGPDHLNYAGVAYVLVAGTCWGAYILVGGRVALGGRRADTLAVAMVFSAAVLVVPALLQAAPALTSTHFLLLAAGVGVLSSAIPYSVELMAMQRVSSTIFGVLLSLQPLMAALMGLAVLGQHISLLEGTGLVMVIAASVGVTLGGGEATAEPVAAT